MYQDLWAASRSHWRVSAIRGAAQHPPDTKEKTPKFAAQINLSWNPQPCWVKGTEEEHMARCASWAQPLGLGITHDFWTNIWEIVWTHGLEMIFILSIVHDLKGRRTSFPAHIGWSWLPWVLAFRNLSSALNLTHMRLYQFCLYVSQEVKCLLFKIVFSAELMLYRHHFLPSVIANLLHTNPEF